MTLRRGGGEHREPQGHRTIIQRNHIDILVEKWEKKIWVQETGIVFKHDSVNLWWLDHEILGCTGRQEMTRALCVRSECMEHTHIRGEGGLLPTEDSLTSQCKESSSFRSLYFFCVLNYSVNGVLSMVCLTGWQETQQGVTFSFAQKKKKKEHPRMMEREIKISAEQTGPREDKFAGEQDFSKWRMLHKQGSGSDRFSSCLSFPLECLVNWVTLWVSLKLPSLSFTSFTELLYISVS